MRVGRRGVAVENKALILLTAKASMKQRLIQESEQLGSVLVKRIDSSSKSVNVMARIARDPFALTSKLAGYDVTTELRADAELEAFALAVSGARSALPSASTDPSATVVIIGSDYLFRPRVSQAVRFQYLIVRRVRGSSS
jgi:hypothetical protein